MLLWSVLHLTRTQAVNADYERLGHPSVSLEDIRHFRQLDSKAPGHPEYHWVSGVETTTGPLGQGVATSVGMGIAEKWLANRYNRPGFEIFNYNIYAICGDGCLMEGVASEAASLAGHLGLDNLCWIYDNNHITIEGKTRITFTEDVEARFLAYGWNVLRVGDANDIERIEHALDIFHKTKDRPTFIVLDSHIGYGSPHQAGHCCGPRRAARRRGGPAHQASLRLARGCEVSCARRRLRTLCRRDRRARCEGPATMDGTLCRLSSQVSRLATEIEQMQRRELPAGWDRNLPVFPADPKGIAGRDASGKVLNVLAQNIPWFLGGSADLGPSNKTTLTYEGAGDFEPDNRAGKNLHFGIREHAMAATVNGLSLSKLRAFGATFFIFSDYARPAIRLSALMELPTIFIFTHDAMGDGEDGPTHQPVEHLASLRAIPGLVTLRPGDANEVVEAYRYIMQLRHEPAVLVLSRQPLPTLDRKKYAPASGVARGAYVLADASGGNPEVILIASGSEVSLAVEAHEKLVAEGIRSRVVSMPSWDIFEHQTQEYQDERAAAAGDGARRGGAGIDFRMGALRRQVGPHDRHENFRRLGAAKRTPEKVRLRAGPRGGGCKGIARQELRWQRRPFLEESSAHTLVAGDLAGRFPPGSRNARRFASLSGRGDSQARGRSRSCCGKGEQRGNPASVSVGEPAC